MRTRPSTVFRTPLAVALGAVLGALLSLGALPLLAQSFDPRKGEDDCPPQPMVCGETVMSELTAGDCQDDQGRLLDSWAFSGTSGETVTASLFSNDFEPHLELLDPTGEDVAEAQGENPGDTAEIVFVLTATSSGWRLIAKADDPGVTGSYDLTLQCSGTTPPPPPPPGFFIDPAYPDFRFRVRIGPQGSARAGVRETPCQPETVCVSGAVPGRSELFLRILGPRPNGFLWPTVVRFTPSRVEVDVQQVSSGLTRTYVLPAVPPGVEDLSGRQDRTGFLP